MADNILIYEQPLNELVRVCLRLEQLFQQIDHQVADTSALGTRDVLAAMINLLNLVDRPDLKAKLAKELTHHMTMLTRLENTPEIDEKKLHELLQQIDELVRSFIDTNGKIGQPLRDLELFNTLRLHLSTPGGACSFDMPFYHHWLQQPSKERHAMIKSWLAEFNNVRAATEIILRLIRESTKVQPKTAEKGFYQELLDPQLNLRLIRVGVPNTIEAFPEISISRHFMGIRFFDPNIHERATQYKQDLPFWLSYCIS